MPGARNLLSRAGEDLGDLPEPASGDFFQSTVADFNSTFQALDFESVWQFSFCGANIVPIATSVSFPSANRQTWLSLYLIGLFKTIKPIRNERRKLLFTAIAQWRSKARCFALAWAPPKEHRRKTERQSKEIYYGWCSVVHLQYIYYGDMTMYAECE